MVRVAYAALLLAGGGVLLGACINRGGDTPGGAWASFEGTMTGHGSFSRDNASLNRAGVMLFVSIDECVDGTSYRVFIHDGANCASPGGHWDSVRGEGIPDIVCRGTSGRVDYTRDAMDPSLAWAIDGEEEMDVAGHTLAVHDVDDKIVACGNIHWTYPL